MTRFMVRVYEAEPNTNTRWKSLLDVRFDDEHEPEHGGYTPLEWALLEAGQLSAADEDRPVTEPHDHPGLLSGRGVPHVHKGGEVHETVHPEGKRTPEEQLFWDIFGKQP